MRARAIQVLGCSSDAGKSALATALCRILARRGVSVAPFKAWNMSLNSDVAPDGREVARAQSLQALACGIAPRAEMSPVLVKPEGEGRSQVVLLGRVRRPRAGEDAGAASRRAAGTAWRRLSRAFEAVVIEGAGAAAEPNLRERDLANLWASRASRAPSVIVADVERGGAFAALYGTWAMLPDDVRARVAGFVVNRLRGSARALGSAPAELSRRTGVPVLGVVPQMEGLMLDAEDAVSLERLARAFAGDPRALRIAVPRLPSMANFTDLDPLRVARGVDLALVTDPAAVRAAHVVLIPGSKYTARDLVWMRRAGLAAAITEKARDGGIVVGLCGGYQMMGERIEDPRGVERRGTTPGLGLLPAVTRFAREKILARTSATCLLPFYRGAVSGYEVHRGRTASAGRGGGAFRSASLGAATPDGRVMGTYLHGVFEEGAFRAAFLSWARRLAGLPRVAEDDEDHAAKRLRAIDLWTDIVKRSVKVDRLFAAAGIRAKRAGRGATA